MESKKDYGQNGIKMVKKEEKEILEMVKEIVHGLLGMKTVIRNFQLVIQMENLMVNIYAGMKAVL